MCNESHLATLFGQFAGRDIALLEEKKASPVDPVFMAMTQIARDKGYRLRLIWNSHTTLTTDHDPKRANVQMERQRDGTWHVGTHYHAG